MRHTESFCVLYPFIAFSMAKPPVLPGVSKKALANKLVEPSSKAKEKDPFSSRENFVKGNAPNPKNSCKP